MLNKEQLHQAIISQISAYIGIREDQGDNRSKIIDLINKYMGLALGSPYCLSAIQYCLGQVEKQNDGVKFYLPFTGHCQTFFNSVNPKFKHSTPQAGDVVIWKYAGTSSGHAGYVEKVLDGGRIQTIEFNTRDSTGVIREGDGCYRCVRSVKGSKLMPIMGFVRIVDASNAV